MSGVEARDIVEAAVCRELNLRSASPLESQGDDVTIRVDNGISVQAPFTCVLRE